MEKSLTLDLKFYEVQPTPSIPLWRMKPSGDPRWAAWQAALKFEQKKHGFPDILPIGTGEGKRVDLTREWQRYLMAIKPAHDAPRCVGVIELSGRLYQWDEFRQARHAVPKLDFESGHNLKKVERRSALAAVR